MPSPTYFIGTWITWNLCCPSETHGRILFSFHFTRMEYEINEYRLGLKIISFNRFLNDFYSVNFDDCQTIQEK